MFNNKIEHGASTVGPGGQMKRYGVSGYFDEATDLGNYGFGAFGPGVQHIRLITGANAAPQHTGHQKLSVILCFRVIITGYVESVSVPDAHPT